MPMAPPGPQPPQQPDAFMQLLKMLGTTQQAGVSMGSSPQDMMSLATALEKVLKVMSGLPQPPPSPQQVAGQPNPLELLALMQLQQRMQRGGGPAPGGAPRPSGPGQPNLPPKPGLLQMR